MGPTADMDQSELATCNQVLEQQWQQTMALSSFITTLHSISRDLALRMCRPKTLSYVLLEVMNKLGQASQRPVNGLQLLSLFQCLFCPHTLDRYCSVLTLV